MYPLLSVYITVSLFLFLECFSEVKYVTFLPEQTRQLLLYLWRFDIDTTKEAATITCEESLQAKRGTGLTT